MYQAVKHLHVACVSLSGLGFLLRAGWMLSGSPLLSHRLTRILPHVVDTLLLGSAIVLVTYYGAVPDWVWAKVAGLVVYVVLGSLALKRGRTRSVRIAALVAAIGTFGWIVSVALTKSVAGFFGCL
ncbi:SirB2 family protein [Denitromonas iodatirespirans]|uniref:SirB2 family protein n=1 Tax=Denitromonas iodatirespirans TaxID=2795389 RepID=A0A944H7H9_DENI1|nr:SirB2 family protein [Denitromonas iodatirespirans]MBT0961253.1 SirB2 family protein [Denitromonas iodatirespirans]